MVSAWFGGLGPGLVATALSIVAAALFSDGRVQELLLSWPAGVVRSATFVLTGAVISGLCELLHQTRRRLESARAQAEASEKRSVLLDKVTASLTSSLDYEKTLKGLVRLAVPAIADHCLVVVFEGTKGRCLAAAHSGLAVVDGERERAMMPVQRLQEPVLYGDLGGEVQPHWDTQQVQQWRRIGIVSGMVAPLNVPGRALGVIFFGSERPELRYGPDDVDQAQAIAERAALAIDNAHLYREAQEANRIKDEFLATLSHELRTPLNAIVGWAHLLQEGQLDPVETARASETILRNAKAQNQLIADLMDVSRIVTGKLRLDVRPLDLRAAIEAALDVVQPAAAAKQIAISWRPDGASSDVVGDADRLQQVFWNLLSNAIKFTPEGGRVAVQLARQPSCMEVTIKDTGVGIEPEFLDHVFDRFRQADSSSTRGHRGLGLGLAIVRHLVELHGGTVRATSPGPGQGTTFVLTLPAMALARPQAAFVAPKAPADRPLPSARLDRLSLLVVDDDRDGRELVAHILRSQGATVTMAASASEAMDRLRESRFDVLLSDLEMPVQDGYSLVRWLRRLPASEGGRTPAVALTAYVRPQDQVNALRAGFHMHVGKPVRPGELVAVVSALSTEVQGEVHR
jgi:signal transduction histidine kinase/ActR/RegA family two-component response regulator